MSGAVSNHTYKGDSHIWDLTIKFLSRSLHPVKTMANSSR